ncbi:MAG: ankyrin repeat domain-containing protein, partial [Bradyrhizobium sp.]|uniref:ankyrin repeat domain-containing protein n=1 Tax=Bradyrhizobium sp. TaxID=376 RepID=UPI001DCBE9C2
MVLYLSVPYLWLVAIALLPAATAARADDEARCRELTRQFQDTKSQMTAIEVSQTLFSATDANCVPLATELLDFGASVDARDRLGARPLSHAARLGNIEIVDLLLARGAPINARNLPGATALYFAAERGHAAIAQRLIERGADVNLVGRSELSPVAAAAYGGHDTIVEMLLAHGADAQVVDATGKPAIVYAAGTGRLD